LGIGDGGNDVGMIQAADIGVGIVGKEGNQAALAADFSILEFRHLKCLLLWHGRLSYKRSALLANFIIHRGFIVSTIQIIFSCLFFFVSIPVFNSYLQLGYATIFTFWPVFSLILDEDIDVTVLLFRKREL
jgi:phospholipid-translocating ATPase